MGLQVPTQQLTYTKNAAGDASLAVTQVNAGFPGNAALYLDGTGNFSTPAGGGGGGSTAVGDITGLGTGIATFLATPTSANLATAITNETGSGALVFATSPSLVTPALGVASATTINRVTLTTPATGSTLTIVDGKTFTVSKSITLDGTDSTTMVFPSTNATIARTDAGQTFTGTQIIGALTVTTINGNTFTTGTGVLTIAAAKTFTVNNTLTITSTDGITMTTPSTSFTVARTDAANTFTGTQTVGALVATTVNGNTFTTGTGVLTIAASKTLTISNTLTLAGTDSTTMTFPSTSATIARTDSAQTFTGVQTFVAPILGTPTSVTLTNATGLPAAGVTGTAAVLNGNNIFTANGALSSGAGPGFTANGTWITGGSATTTKPYVLIEVTSTTSTGWNTNGTGIGVNAASGFTGNLIDLQTNGVSLFKVEGVLGQTTISTVKTTNVTSAVSDSVLQLQNGIGFSSANKFAIGATVGTLSQTSGTNGAFKITVTYNQASGSAANTDLFINRTQTAVGSGAQLLIDAQVSTVSKFNVDNTGIITVAAAGAYTWTSSSALFAPSDGIIRVTNAAGTGYTRLQFGVVGATGPALTTTIQTNPILTVTDGTGGKTALLLPSNFATVSVLPNATTAAFKGCIANVLDALAPALGATVVGGGAAFAQVVCNGANWTVTGV